MKLLHLLPEEDEDERRPEEDDARAEAISPPVPTGRPLAIPWHLVLWAGGLAPRLFALFFLTNPENAGVGWHGDVYHHWQIAYLTKEIGLWDPSGPRLWDLKGLDYFWGVLHPIMLVILFYITGSIDIVIPRLLSCFFGAMVVALIFHLCRRHWGTQVAIAAAAFAAVSPVDVFVDSTGFLEPLGVSMVLLGIWLWPKRGVWTGVAFALAAMARAEAWVFSLGMIIAAFLNPRPEAGLSREEKRWLAVQRVPLIMAWAIGIALYMKILLDRTGNPIYPVYENFLVNAFGQWEFRSSLTPDELAARPYLAAVLAVGVVGLLVVLWKRPPSYMFLTFGFGYLVFTGGMLGFTAYLKSWESWFWMERFFDFPYEFAAVLVVLGLFVLAPRLLGKRFVPVAWTVFIACLLVIQVEWPPMLAKYQTTSGTWQQDLTAGSYIGQVYHQPQYDGKVINIPPDPPDLVYTLARFDDVQGKHIVGQLYDPFYYLPTGYKYRGHEDLTGPLLQCWLIKTHSSLFAVDSQSNNYINFIADHPTWFSKIGEVPGMNWTMYEVDVPHLSSSQCALATKTANKAIFGT